MKIALIGATGYVGSAILREALDRGHEITAIVRNPARLPAHARLTAVAADVHRAELVAAAVAGLDAVISAFSPGLADPELHAHHLAGARAILDGVQRAGVVRIVVVGGAGSLEVAPGVQLVDTPEFPAAWKATALATRDVLGLLRAEPALRWTFVSPPMHLEPGDRTGTYRTATDGKLLFDARGESRISVADYAVAMLDEVERAAHIGQRIAVAY